MILRISAKLQNTCTPLITLQLHPTTLRFRKAEPLDESGPSFIDFGATAWVISQSTMAVELLPKVKEVYTDWIDPIAPQAQQGASPSIDVEWDTISSIVTAHYGYLEGSASAILFVLPTDVTAIRDKIKVQLPIDCLVSEAPATPQEQADSLMALMQFHDQLSKYLYKEDPIDMKTISRLLVLLRQYFRFKRHGSGQLFYVRAVGIAGIVAEWVFHSPKVIYASLLYELVRHTCLPLSYIKEHYNLVVYAFVSNVVTIDQHEALHHPSLLYVKNRLEKAIKADHVQLSVLFIKLAERLYDLRQAAGYRHLSKVAHMVEETRTIDIQIANTYLGPEVGAALEAAAKEALAICKDTR